MWNKLLIITIFSFLTSGAIGQTVEPPTSADEFGWLRWAVILLLGIVISGSGAFFAFLKKSYESRIEDKVLEIKTLSGRLAQVEQNNKDEVTRLISRIDQLTSEKDVLHKDMQEKVIPALTSASDLIRTFLTNAK